jgi:hypothetical protein
MGTNNKNSPSNDRTFMNVSPNNKKSSSGPQQRPAPSKSISIKTPNKNQQSNQTGQTNNKRVSGSCSPPNFNFFAASKCFESPSPQSLPKPPMSWFDEGSKSNKRSQRTPKSQRVRKSLNLSAVESSPSSCAQEFAKQQNSSLTSISNDQYTQQLKFLLNVNA